MKEKLFKYYKILIFAFLSLNLISLYFIYTAQFKTVKNDNVLDFLPTISVAYGEYRSALSWVALVLMTAAWILWEVATSRFGKKIYALISMGLFFIQMLLILNMLSIIGILLALFLMSYYTWEKIEWNNSVKATEGILLNAEENKKNNKKFKDLFKWKSNSKI